MVSESFVDVVGVGFGPSNISLAIAAKELTPNLQLKFFEAKANFDWHGNMLFPNAAMQISFLKDLATFRNPLSKFSFLNYLHLHMRLADFANLSQFCVSREEFSDYLSWCAQKFENQVSYGHRVMEVRPQPGPVPLLRVIVEDTDGGQCAVNARALVCAAGLRPSFPQRCQPGGRIIHCSKVLETFDSVSCNDAFDVTVVGGGQSAAEVVEYLHDNFPHCRINAVVSTFGYMPADDTAFVNQIFDSGWVGPFFDAAEEVKQEVLARHGTTNYAAVRTDLIATLYKKSYRDKFFGEKRLNFCRLTRLYDACEIDERVDLRLFDKLKGRVEEVSSDYLVCATGYSPQPIEDILAPELSDRLHRDDQGRVNFSRTYRVGFEGAMIAPIYCVGMNQYSHGLSSTLLSNIAIRSGEIIEDLAKNIRKVETAIPAIGVKNNAPRSPDMSGLRGCTDAQG